MSFEETLEMENPMLVNSVLETVFGLLALEDLKTCRFVCSIWKTEGFRALRKRTCINLSSKPKLRSFLSFNQCNAFTKFHFKIRDWNNEISAYLLEVQPSQIEVEMALRLVHGQEECGNGERILANLLLTQNRTISKLVINVEWTDSDQKEPWTFPENLMSLLYPLLKEFAVLESPTGMSATWLYKLWISVLSNSPELDIFRLKNVNEEDIWKGISTTTRFSQLKALEYVDDSASTVSAMYQNLIQNPLPRTCLQRFCVSFDEGCQELLGRILEQLAETLEVLEFYTQDQSALSPITFPVMPNLRILDAGSSQFSFPSISPATLPKLSEIKATYWDWVYTLERVPDTRYYWRTTDPHHCITDISLRFPSWFDINMDYIRLEIFEEFRDVLISKFPNACNLTFYNVSVSDDIRRALESLFHRFMYRLKSFKIASYYSSDVTDPTPFEVTIADEESDELKVLEVLDLGTCKWPDLWKSHPTMLSNIRDEWLPALTQFENLRVLKILWAKHLFTLLQLTHVNVLPNLEHLEFVGYLCVDRFDRAKVEKVRPLLRLIQHKNCCCPEEDWWYMHDPQSDKIFKDLFSKQPKLPLSDVFRNIYHHVFSRASDTSMDE